MTFFLVSLCNVGVIVFSTVMSSCMLCFAVLPKIYREIDFTQILKPFT